jgi:sugar/nucleoside kinase (ribokinase family)
MKRVLGLVDFAKPNELEFSVLTGETEPHRASRTLVEWGARIGIVTLAERGSVVYDGDKWLTVPAYPTVASDPTGAGDTYAGSFIFEYDRTGSPADSACFASAAASMKVENTGPDFPMNMDDVRRRADHIRPLTKCQH